MKIGDMARVIFGSYRGKAGRINSIFSHVKPFQMRGVTNAFETIYEIQLLDDNESICFPENYLQLINEQNVSHYSTASVI